MKKIALLYLLIWKLGSGTFAQNPKLPVIRATSTSIKIRDGEDLREGGLAPELKPDIYRYYRSATPKTVTYYTDIDSISFTVQSRSTHDFIILLNGKDSCFQRITADAPSLTYHRLASKGASKSDTIAFTLGPNNAIHLPGRFNQSVPLDLIFDTGANMGVLSEEGLRKGVNLQPGLTNQIRLDGVQITRAPIMFVDYNGGLKADGVIGYNSFDDKVVMIDYDRQRLIVQDSLTYAHQGYAVAPMHWQGDNLFIEGDLITAKQTSQGLFLFDTGSKWALSLTKAYSTSQHLYGLMDPIGTRAAKGVNGKPIESTTVTLPTLSLAGLRLHQIPIDLELATQQEGLRFNILGNDVLKRFNVILDYRSGLIYLKPNGQKDAPYSTPWSKGCLIGGGIAILILVSGLIWRLLRKKPLSNVN